MFPHAFQVWLSEWSYVYLGGVLVYHIVVSRFSSSSRYVLHDSTQATGSNIPVSHTRRRSDVKLTNQTDARLPGALDWQVPDPMFTSLVQHLDSQELR